MAALSVPEPPRPPPASQSLLEVGGQGKAVAPWEPAVRNLGLRPDEDVPPPDVVLQ